MSLKTTFFAIALAVLASTSLQAQQLLVPGPASESIEGGSSNTRPFSSDFDFGARYQQVWDASAFGSVPGTLTSVAFRYDGGGNPGGNVYAPASYEVKLSTTALDPGTLSATFDDNIGAGETVVLSTDSLSILFPGDETPNDFVPITFDTPFLYDPNAGNLLLDITYQGQAVGIGSIDTYTEAEAMGITSRVHTGFGTTSGFTSTGFSAVVQFEFTPVPEPTSVALLALGIGACALRRRA